MIEQTGGAAITIDGSMGEGGGQVLRSSLALSVLTQRPLNIHSIRAGRRRPGLMRQHLTAAQATAEICGGVLDGAELGGSRLFFRPGPVRGGEYNFAVGSAGSTTLVLQTILLPLLAADEPSVVRIEGGTHNPMAPPFEFIERCFLPLLRTAGARVQVRLLRYGFAPAGGGCLEVHVEPSSVRAVCLDEAKPIVRQAASVVVAGLSRSIAERECDTLRRKLNLSAEPTIQPVESRGPGNVAIAEVDRGDVREVAVGFGEIGVRAERVARTVTAQIRGYLAAEVPVGRYLADQLLLPMAVAGAGRFVTMPLSRHALTNIEVIEQFVPIRFEVTPCKANVRVEVMSVVGG